VITNIDIGNAGAAFIEVQVGRLGADPDQMKVLLVASSFMSVNEARVGDNMGRVRMFGVDKLSKEVAKEKWDLVKVVLTQPFTKILRYGLSFISLSGPTASKCPDPTTPKPTTLGAFRLKDESDANIATGSLFARQRAGTTPTTNSTSVAASLRDEDTVRKTQEKKRKREVNLTPAMIEEAKKRKVGPRLVLPSRNSLPGEDSDREEDDGVDIFKKKDDTDGGKQKNKNRDQAGTVKHETDTARKGNQKKVEKDDKKNAADKLDVSKVKDVNCKPNKYAPFNELLKGVIFTISGFQNPLRGEIRKKGLDMGAKYCGDWNNSCTHLICAFANTPKFNQVVGKGKIVKKEWLEECHSQRKKLPWRRFCLDKRDQGREESEDEVWETIVSTSRDEEDMDTDEEIEKIKREESARKGIEGGDKSKVGSSANRRASNAYECDTDEEIEKIKVAERIESSGGSPPPKNIDPYNCDTDDELEQKDITAKSELKTKSRYDCETDEETPDIEVDPYDAETDIDEEELEKLMPNTKKLSLGKLPDFFNNHQFFLHGDFKPAERQLLERYIIACGGKVEPYMGAEVKVVITHSRWDRMFEDVRKVSHRVEFVDPKWLFKCKNEGRMLEFGHYRIEK